MAVGFLSANKKPMSAHESIYVFSKLGANYNRINIEGDFPKSHSKGTQKLLNVNTYNGGQPLPNTPTVDNSKFRCVKSWFEIANKKEKGGHPTAKPNELYKWLIERYSKEGDMVLDPTFGSCNSGAVSRELNRNYIGIEMNKEFYDKAVERLLK
jgi:DNA modification methylase